jgi:two-component system response regulator HydG
MVDTTIPHGADTGDAAGHQVPAWAFVLLWSREESHRVGEVAFLPPFERSLVGRGDEEVEKFAHFGVHRPGEPRPRPSRKGFLAGSGISRRQLLVRATAVGVEMERVGRATTLVNGEEKTSAALAEGDTVLIRGGALLLCVRRPRTLPGPPARHAFGGPDADGIVGEAPATWALREELAKSAATDHDVLIQGESGTGKELAATAIHQRSKRAKGPFVARNASSFTVSLADSELYGNSANYPNPGMPARKGLLGTADRGTLFLDEVGDCPLEVQTRLLRVLDAGEYQPVGEATSRRVDVRVVGATNKDDSAFRPDFRARFRDSVRIPPLRERREDIPLLIRHWLLLEARESPELANRLCRVGTTGALQPKVSGRLVDYLVRQPLPRNVRELEAFLVRALKESQTEDNELRLPRSVFPSTTTPPPEPPEAEEETVERAPPPTKEEVLAAWTREGKNISGVAKRLGLGRNVVYRLMREYGIKKEDTDP